MNTDNNQKKQLTELSDEDLKKVNGGVRGGGSITQSNEPLNIVAGIPISGNPAAGIGGGTCPDSEKDKFGNCIPEFTVTN